MNQASRNSKTSTTDDKNTQTASTPPLDPGRARPNRLVYLVASSVALGLFTTLALVQSPLKTPHAFPTIFDTAFWKYPLVLNGIKQLPSILVSGKLTSPDLNAVWVSPDGNQVWVGGGASLFHNRDGENSWERLLPGYSNFPTMPQTSSISKSGWTLIPVVSARSFDALQQPAQSGPANQSSKARNSNNSKQTTGASDTPVDPTNPSTTNQSTDLPNQTNKEFRQEATGNPQSLPVVGPPANPVGKTASPPDPVVNPTPPPTSVKPPFEDVKPPPSKQRTVIRQTPPNFNPPKTPESDSERKACSFVGNDIIGFYFLTDLQGSVRFGPTPLGNSSCLTVDGGKTWIQNNHSEPDLSLLSASSQPSATLQNGYQVEVGPRGSITIVNGPNPVKRVSHTIADLKAVRFSTDGRIGFAVGTSGTVLKTLDGGGSWFPVLQGLEGENLADKEPRKLPAPWYYVSLLMVCFIAWPALREIPEKRLPSEESIANLGVSDRPLEPTDYDPLGYKDIALSISRFIRNENTIAPITIAITGDWGTGKSSIMNLMRRDLKMRGLRPIWFNAWHNQTEEDLFATILQNIRQQGIPCWWQPDYFAFRLRLLWMRWKDRKIPVTLLLMAIAFLTGVEWQHWNDHRVDNLIESLKTWGQFIDSLKSISKDRLWILFVCVLYAAKYLYDGMKAFGVNPASLLSSRSNQTTISDLEKQTALRQRFGDELGEVTRALGTGKRMVLFVDDLDRCLPDNIRVVLEAINFIITSGECFVVMGYARAPVEAGVGLSFEKIAAEMSRHSAIANDVSTDQIAKNDRLGFAQQYLDKLINIEIPARPKSSARVEDLVLDNARPAIKESSLHRLSRIAVDILLPGLLAVLFVCLMAWTGLKFSKPRLIPGAGIIEPASTPQSLTSLGEKLGNQPEDAFKSADSRQSATLSISTPEQTRNDALAYFWAGTSTILLIYLFWHALRKKDEGKVKDSSKFRRALEIWDFVIVLTHRTPRSTKRFMNRVRCLAMRLRPTTEAEARWSYLRPDPVGNSLAFHPSLGRDQLPESSLVALSVMYDISPEILQNEDLFKSAIAGSLDPLSKAGGAIDPRVVSQFREAVEKHRAMFSGDWPPSPDQRRAFLDMFTDFTVRG